MAARRPRTASRGVTSARLLASARGFGGYRALADAPAPPTLIPRGSFLGPKGHYAADSMGRDTGAGFDSDQ